ncbi:MAG TPA: minor capsid protein [Anaerolineaceae bacterium]|nr:minor capsid protein [Anaerolineaceae bacterium]
MAKGPVIKTPRGRIFINKNGKAELVWNTNFQPKWQKRYSEAQKFVDSEVLRLCEPYVPLRTGMLIKSGILGTEIGSGEVKYIAPYARRQYYSRRKPGSQTGPLRGPYWFQRMKEVHGRRIIEGARRIAGGGK